MGFFLETVIGGLMSGMLYTLVALGFVLIFKASGVFNFAQGAMVLIAALAMARLSGWIDAWLGGASPVRIVCTRKASRRSRGGGRSSQAQRLTMLRASVSSEKACRVRARRRRRNAVAVRTTSIRKRCGTAQGNFQRVGAPANV